MAGVVKGKIRLWQGLDTWNGQVAAAAYEGLLEAALRKAYPSVMAHVVLEDNDPAGYKSSKALAAKRRAKINTLDLPKRSPDLNVLDHSLWPHTSQRMRATEGPRGQKAPARAEGEYKKRLRRTALLLPKAVVAKAVEDMHRRILDLQAAEGRHFEE